MNRLKCLCYSFFSVFFFYLAPLCLFAQEASVQWDLTTHGEVSSLSGSLAASPEQFSYSPTDSAVNLQVKDYTAQGGGQRVNLGAKPWPYESAENPNRYVQFRVQPLAGFTLRVSTISLEMGGGGTSAMRATVYYSLDSTFANRIQLGTTYSLPNSAWLDPAPSFTTDVEVPSGATLYVRVYVWYNSSNASTSKYLYLRNVRIVGITTQVGERSVPLVATLQVREVTGNSAVCDGTVMWDGGLTVTERGICWNTTGLPTIADARTIEGSGTGEFTSVLVGLERWRRYYVRAYATNALGTAYGDELSFIAQDPQLAFPGAEGYGKYTLGGRGGAVIEVTNLNDSGPGSLRAAVETRGPRTVVFRVSGTIALNSPLKIQYPFITIAGQTAPGDGICLKNYPLEIYANHVVIRYLRIRLGDEAGIESDAISARGVKNVILDHCSASWSVDETMSLYWCDSITVQWCYITESLYNSNHIKGAHGYGGIWGGPNATFHHNLLAHHSSRNPRFASGVGNTDFRNNVIFNWGFNSAYGGEDTSDGSAKGYSWINMVGNYYKAGPATLSSVRYRIVGPSTKSANKSDVTRYGRWYVVNNVVEGYPNVTGDNSLGVHPDGGTAVLSGILSPTPFPSVSIEEQSAQLAYAAVLEHGGASRPKRDAVDERIASEAAGGYATYNGVTYCNDKGLDPSTPRGIIDSQTDVGGWPLLTSTSAPEDTDHDGMPDSWELAHGLNPNDPEDRNFIQEDGYTNLEHYLNSDELLTGIAAAKVMPLNFSLEQNYPNPFNPTTAIRYAIPHSGRVVLKVYDLLGREIRTLVDEYKSGGKYLVTFDATGLASGLYVCRLQFGNDSQIRKMLLTK